MLLKNKVFLLVKMMYRHYNWYSILHSILKVYQFQITGRVSCHGLRGLCDGHPMKRINKISPVRLQTKYPITFAHRAGTGFGLIDIDLRLLDQSDQVGSQQLCRK